MYYVQRNGDDFCNLLSESMTLKKNRYIQREDDKASVPKCEVLINLVEGQIGILCTIFLHLFRI